MKRVFGLVFLAPGLLGAQPSAPRAWFTTVGELHATHDGWVEWQVARPDAPPPHHDEYYGITARLAPDAVRAWVAAARRALGDTAGAARTAIPDLTDGGAGISLTVHRPSPPAHDEMFAWSCRGNADVGPSRGDVRLLVDALDAAARAAASLRPSPADRGAGPFSAAEVTCPAWPRRAYMPAWPPDHEPRPADRGEALARFVVLPDGRVDLSTVVWDAAPAPAAERAARAVLADWRFEPATVGRRRVRQWSHARIWFADSADVAEWQLAGRARTRSFAARRDGRVEHAVLNPIADSVLVPDEAPRLREAYAPRAVSAWRDSWSSPERREGDLVAPGGIVRRGGRFVRYEGCAALAMAGAGRISDSAWTRLSDSVHAAAVEAGRRPLLPIDSTRVHGETEVTCPARPAGPLPRALARAPGRDEVLLSFVVGRGGGVDPASITLLGDPGARGRVRIREALRAQRWEPGRLAGVRVPQRAHLALHPAPEPPVHLATVACAHASAVAVRVRVREPARGIASPDLTRVAHAFSRQLGRQARPAPADGRFTVVLDDAGAPHFFTWARPPADSGAATVVEFALGARFVTLPGESVVPSVPVAPLAVEAELLKECP